MQDADNLVWKLDSVLRGLAPERLLDSYDDERVLAADENLLNTTRSTDFIAPKSAISHAFRDSVLALAETEPFARRLVNSGRLTVATCYDGSPLNGPTVFRRGGMPAGASRRRRARCAARQWLAAPLPLGRGFTGVWFTPDGSVPEEVARTQAGAHPARVARRPAPSFHDATAWPVTAPPASPAFYLFRPDGHVAARWRQPSAADVEAALARATARRICRSGQPASQRCCTGIAGSRNSHGRILRHAGFG